ncbi:ankyrin repeat-containing domain protein [Talaromyces proteolyticus]|uniref:Ankyrin repeat-containing domain protein n=1 Tax=Talaromyces proteolyticus TaxID=1131652 RepID=A0AAD4PVV2_9EURO|nr:ankyrin repeat-containing domain protein [Talaromyces proteolyticus]KAH8691828.1 ankyrin repeat-containing domain protein [Talaromyces proteolyticus]
MFRRSAPQDLINATERNLQPIVQKYLDKGINPNVRTHIDPWYQGLQLLALAAIHGHVDLLKLLLERGAKVDGLDLSRRTALSWAAEHCQYGAVKVLVEHGPMSMQRM